MVDKKFEQKINEFFDGYKVALQKAAKEAIDEAFSLKNILTIRVGKIRVPSPWVICIGCAFVAWVYLGVLIFRH